MAIDMGKGGLYVRRLEPGEKPLFDTVVKTKPVRADQLPDHVVDPSDVRVGDLCRAYDFPGRKDCYMEGTIVGYALVEDPSMRGSWCWRYVQQVQRRVVGDNDVTAEWINPDVPLDVRLNYPAVNGTRFIGGQELFGISHTNLVEKVTSPPGSGRN